MNNLAQKLAGTTVELMRLMSQGGQLVASASN